MQRKRPVQQRGHHAAGKGDVAPEAQHDIGANAAQVPCGHLRLQVPALESGSQWWKHRTGEWGQPGVVTMLVGGGTWQSLEIL